MATVKKAAAPKPASKKDIRKNIETKIELLMAEFKSLLSEKRLKKSIKKAGKALSDGLHHPKPAKKKVAPKKKATPKKK